MKQLYYNETKHLKPDIRDRLLSGECVYRDQEPPSVRFEDAAMEAAYMQGLKTHPSGRRLLSKRDVGKLLDRVHKKDKPD